MSDTVEDRRAARLAELEARKAADAAAVADDAACDLVILDQIAEVVDGAFADAVAQLEALGAQLIRPASAASGYSLVQQIKVGGELKTNLKAIGADMAREARQIVGA